jgi:hypothetical protein
MNYSVTRILLNFFGILLVVGCTYNPFSSSSIFPAQTTAPYSSKEIPVTVGRYDEPYITLGPIEFTLKKYTSFFLNQIDLRNQAIDFLKQEALARYGNKVDAIIDLVIQESTEEGYDGSLSVTHIQGIAIAFKPEIKAIAKHKTRHKSKSSKNTSRKHKQEEIEITPSEILK